MGMRHNTHPQRERQTRVRAICLRIVLFATLMAIVIFGAITPHQMVKVTAERVLIGVAGAATVVQVYLVLTTMRCIPYSIWAVVALDAACLAGWMAAIVVLAVWDRCIVYRPRADDPAAWRNKCDNAKSSDTVLDDRGFGKWIHIVWCPVTVDGQHRLIGNGAARMQMRVLTGLAAVALFFTLLLVAYTVQRGRHQRLFRRQG